MATVGGAQRTSTTQALLSKNAEEPMDVIAAYRKRGSDRGAAAICGTTHKAEKRIIEAHGAATGGEVPRQMSRYRIGQPTGAAPSDRTRSWFSQPHTSRRGCGPAHQTIPPLQVTLRTRQRLQLR